MECLQIILRDESQTIGNSPVELLQPHVRPIQPNPTNQVPLTYMAVFHQVSVEARPSGPELSALLIEPQLLLFQKDLKISV